MKERGATVLITDGGGRGAVLVEAYAKSPHVDRILVVPGNPGMDLNTQGKEVVTFPRLKTTSINNIVNIARDEGVVLADVCQDNAVEVGVSDKLREIKGMRVVGSSSSAGKIESQKDYAREKGKRWGLPQPEYHIFTHEMRAVRFLRDQDGGSWFIKAAGLAEGKGAIPGRNLRESLDAVARMPEFGNAADVFLIEEWIRGDDGSEGEEFSSYAISDGTNYQVVGHAQDNKRVFNGDEGLNTGGMGCSTPPQLLTPDMIQSVDEEIFNPTFKGLQGDGETYQGVLYLGGMAVKRNGVDKPYVVEFNARWGDPEAQVIIPGLNVDFFELGMAIADGDISQLDIRSDGKARVVVAGASKGYPTDYSEVKGKEIFGLYDVLDMEGVKLYTAGVTKEDEKFYVNGGRIFYIVGEGANILQARERAYAAISHVFVEGNNLHFRTDIGFRDVARLHETI